MNKYINLLLLCTALLLSGCDNAVKIINGIYKKGCTAIAHTPEDYIALAEIAGVTLSTSYDVNDHEFDSQKFNDELLDLRMLQTYSSETEGLKNELIQIGTDIQALSSMPDTIWGLNNEKSEKSRNIYERLMTVNRKLPKIAKNYAKDFESNNGRIVIDYDEYYREQGAFRIANTGDAINNATIKVTINNSYISTTWVCFTKQLSNKFLNVRSSDRELFLPDVTSIDVEVYSGNFSTKFTYTYGPEQRAEDFKRKYENIVFSGTWQPKSLGIFSDYQRTADLSTNQYIPQCTIQMDFHKDSDKNQTLYWHKFTGYSDSLNQSLEAGNDMLSFEPTSIDITISFDSNPYQIKKSLDVTNNRITQKEEPAN